ncbi:MAG: YggS family pyridoxal phosphate-dependent enzyme [Alphaproteobacteria bacterium]|nr:YggS family pyridoxal phosphate-dependent enzyme [Alphaproteobacteria bacterium]
MSDPATLSIAARLATVRAQLAEAARHAGHSANAVTLVAVSKTQPVSAIEAALAAGQRDFGENRVQEAQSKFSGLKARYPDLRLHLIGPLQTNKARDAVGLFDVIHTLDRPRLAEALARAMEQEGRRPALLVEVNIGDEPQKAGIAPADADGFIADCRARWRLAITGLMCIPPADADPTSYFTALAALARRNGLAELSMGMSADFPLAVAHGATLVRVGTAIFGPRPRA